jgi:hypothetical protein
VSPDHIFILALSILGASFINLVLIPVAVSVVVSREVRGLESRIMEAQSKAEHANRNAITVHGEVRDLEKRMTAVEDIIHKDCPLLAKP